jgi:hypothetical protein
LASLRICNRCKRELPISEFYNPPSGMRYSCKKCDYEYARDYDRTHAEFARESYRNYARRNSRRRWATACLSGHHRRGHIIQLTCEELYQIAAKTELCFICGIQIDWQLGNKGHMNNLSPTLDRLDNEEVIRKDNILILCYKCNATKRDRTLREFVEYCEAVAKKFHSHFE